MYNLMIRRKEFVNTDPLKRCYNGCYARYEMRWLPWEVLHSNLAPEKRDETLAYWKDLNDFAVSQRGEDARCEFKIVEVPDEESE